MYSKERTRPTLTLKRSINLFDLKIIQQITNLQRKKLIWLSENKIAKCIVSITLTDITESRDQFHNSHVVDNINHTNRNPKETS